MGRLIIGLMSSTLLRNKNFRQLTCPCSRLRPRSVSVLLKSRPARGWTQACDANSCSSRHALIAAAQMGLEKARIMSLTHWLRGPASAHQLTQGSKKRGRDCTRSENYKKTLIAWGVLVEALRNCSLVRAATEVENASSAHLATRRACERAVSQLQRVFEPCSPKLALLAAEAWCMGGPEADASLMRLTARGVVQFEAAMVEVLAACSQRHKAGSLLALHTVSCYPTRLISPAAQRRAMELGPRSRWESGCSSGCGGP
ncbi:hypothetical protein BU25DRAFT_7066 [Macroventuria anomochaeta]|uniref:Uncharacterized protein n=1 Tax=Macroventuria anomochaeta TaxID=301207 RepID=A0ACB6SHJ7_9PLEO|nr:uncharacterized protein BU25DRAFT_7066 [Macroventuria anomochaeta]KAF2633468.1 hypothetical protein BU25DRAFT_7066 [Macroventuria anomochaeta]